MVSRKKKKNFPVIFGSVIIGIFVVVAVFCEQIAPYDPAVTNIGVYLRPSSEHLLGTNDLGQDIFSELIYGTRVSMLIGVFAAVIVTVVGTTFALLSAYYGGIVDRLIISLTSLAMAVPGLALTTLLVCYLNPGKISIILAISITAWTGTARILRSRLLTRAPSKSSSTK